MRLLAMLLAFARCAHALAPPVVRVCGGTACSASGLGAATLETAKRLAGSFADRIETCGCRGKCGAGRVSVVGPSDRVYDVENASPATLAAVLEIEADVAVADAAVDACAAFAAIDALRRRDRAGARVRLEAAVADDAFAASPRLAEPTRRCARSPPGELGAQTACAFL